jgi:hypothetical protein
MKCSCGEVLFRVERIPHAVEAGSSWHQLHEPERAFGGTSDWIESAFGMHDRFKKCGFKASFSCNPLD